MHARMEMQVDLGASRHHVVQKEEEVHRGAPLPDLRQDLAGGHLEGGQQRLRTLADVLIAPSAGLPVI